MKFRSFFAGLVLGMALVACASTTTFPFKFYNFSADVPKTGTLLGPTQSDDVPFSQCAPVNGKQQCVAMFYSEFGSMVSSYKTCQQKLIDCQKGQ